jgi:hypothetical protein
MARSRSPLPFLASFLALTVAAWPALAQPQPGLPLPRLTIVTPNGGKLGTTVEVTLTGLDLDEPAGLIFSHPGLKAELIPPPPPPAPDPKKPNDKPPPPPPPKFKVSIAGDVSLGVHDLRFVGKDGISNPRAFVVGDLNEVMEKEPNNDIAEAQKIELGTTVNGSISAPTDVDYYSFAGKKGQRIVASCLASSIDSRVHPLLELYGPDEKALVSNRDYHDNDAVLDMVLPADGDYKVRVCQFTYTQGGPEYFYRLSVSTAPWIDAVFPPLVEPGKPVQLTVWGRGLPGGQIDPTATIDGRPMEKIVVNVNVPNDPTVTKRLTSSGIISPPQSAADGFEYRLRNDSGFSNPVMLYFSKAPVVLDNGATGKREAAQALNVPCEAVGRLDIRKQVAWYSFTAKKGDIYSIELVGDRLNSPTDLALVVYNSDGKSALTELDDDPETLSTNQFFTKTTDPQRYRFVAPADGKFEVLVKAQEANFPQGPRHFYSLRISPEQPNFRLVAMPTTFTFPETVTLLQASRQDYTIYIWRQDGFNGDVALSAEGLPPGVTCKPQHIGTGMKSGTLVLDATADAAPWSGEIKIKGTAIINGQPVVHEARSASLIWTGPGQQNRDTATLTRLDRATLLAVREKAPFVLSSTADKPAVVQGDKVTITFKLERFWPDLKVPVNITGQNLIQNQLIFNNNQPLNVAADKGDGTAVITVAPTCPPGLYCIGFRGTCQLNNKEMKGKQRGNLTIDLPGEPVVLVVLPKQLANLTAQPAGTVKPGAALEVPVKVVRQFDYMGEFKIEVVVPEKPGGLTAPEIVIPAGKDEAKLTFTAAGDAAPGNRPDIIVRATGMFMNTPVVQEIKIAVNIVK